MRTTLTLEDELLAQAHEMTGVAERSTLIHDGLRLLIQREAARRLALLGGSDATATAAPRRRPAVAAAAPRPTVGTRAASKAATRPRPAAAPKR